MGYGPLDKPTFSDWLLAIGAFVGLIVLLYWFTMGLGALITLIEGD